jgi:hypothetical protein
LHVDALPFVAKFQAMSFWLLFAEKSDKKTFLFKSKILGGMKAKDVKANYYITFPFKIR